jgi:ATP-dependent exoDNAse (exonuclease V) alpha subunit
MKHSSPESYFDALEAHFNQLAAAVATGDADALPALTAQVQQLAVNLSEVWQEWQQQSVQNEAMTERLKSLAEGLRLVRTNLLRRASLVEQALKLIIPAAVDPTYASGGAYGAGPRPSGRFGVVSA